MCGCSVFIGTEPTDPRPQSASGWPDDVALLPFPVFINEETRVEGRTKQKRLQNVLQSTGTRRTHRGVAAKGSNPPAAANVDWLRRVAWNVGNTIYVHLGLGFRFS